MTILMAIGLVVNTLFTGCLIAYTVQNWKSR